MTTIIRYFDLIQYSKHKIMPKVIGIDEFKGNTGGQKYNVIITDIENKVVLDILPSREKYELIKHFKSTNREKTEYFVQDMWGTYKEICKTYFKDSEIIIDKYHWIRQVI